MTDVVVLNVLRVLVALNVLVVLNVLLTVLNMDDNKVNSWAPTTQPNYNSLFPDEYK
jgi:hypothetical protein